MIIAKINTDRLRSFKYKEQKIDPANYIIETQQQHISEGEYKTIIVFGRKDRKQLSQAERLFLENIEDGKLLSEAEILFFSRNAEHGLYIEIR